MSTTGEVKDVYPMGGLVSLIVAPVYDTESKWLGVDMAPDEARLLGLRLIRSADVASNPEAAE